MNEDSIFNKDELYIRSSKFNIRDDLNLVGSILYELKDYEDETLDLIFDLMEFSIDDIDNMSLRYPFAIIYIYFCICDDYDFGFKRLNAGNVVDKYKELYAFLVNVFLESIE